MAAKILEFLTKEQLKWKRYGQWRREQMKLKTERVAEMTNEDDQPTREQEKPNEDVY